MWVLQSPINVCWITLCNLSATDDRWRKYNVRLRYRTVFTVKHLSSLALLLVSISCLAMQCSWQSCQLSSFKNFEIPLVLENLIIEKPYFAKIHRYRLICFVNVRSLVVYIYVMYNMIKHRIILDNRYYCKTRHHLPDYYWLL